jgi:hypothetical protein
VASPFSSSAEPVSIEGDLEVSGDVTLGDGGDDTWVCPDSVDTLLMPWG